MNIKKILRELEKNQCVYRDTRWKWNFFEYNCTWECQSIYEPVCEFLFKIFLNFFENCPQLIFL